MLEKSLQLNSDVLIYDLEDSVAPAQKDKARKNIIEFLGVWNISGSALLFYVTCFSGMSEICPNLKEYQCESTALTPHTFKTIFQPSYDPIVSC